MHLGRCCHCGTRAAVTIKRFAGADGTTDWEYGPGLLWSHHYGAAYISGIVPDLTPTLNKYILVADPGSTVPFPDRSAVTLSANAFDAFTITKLNEADGTVSTSATLEGVFGRDVFGDSTALHQPLGMRKSAALSGGDLVILGTHYPQIELDDYSTNPATKNYTFHAHTQQAGDVVFTTVTSSDTITIPYNCTAANCKTQIETSGDVVSATVTGGPWPHAKLNVTVAWNGTGDDFADVTTDATYTVGIGTRSTAGVAAAYSTSTGLITSSVGFVFGEGSGVSESWIISQTTIIPSVSEPPILAFSDMTAGPSDSMVVSVGVTSRWTQKVTVASTWTIDYTKKMNISGFPLHVNSDGNAELSSVKTTYSSPSKTRTGLLLAIAAGTVTEYDDSGGGIPTNGYGHWTGQNGAATTRNFYARRLEFSQADYTGYTFRYANDAQDVKMSSGTYFYVNRTNFSNGFETDGTSALVMSANPGPAFEYDPPLKSPATYSTSSAKAYYWKIWCINGPYDTGTEFRFRFQGNNKFPTWYSGWIDWAASVATIEAGLYAGFAENTEGIVPNFDVNVFGTPAALGNTTGLLERGLDVLIAGHNGSLGYVPTTNIDKLGKVSIETRTVTPRYTDGVVLMTQSNMTETWGRTWGSSGAVTYGYPTKAWLKGGDVYAYGALVDTDF